MYSQAVSSYIAFVRTLRHVRTSDFTRLLLKLWSSPLRTFCVAEVQAAPQATKCRSRSQRWRVWAPWSPNRNINELVIPRTQPMGVSGGSIWFIHQFPSYTTHIVSYNQQILTNSWEFSAVAPAALNRSCPYFASPCRADFGVISWY